jgi:5-methylcytosine-specific restriction endonuclease McrA
VSRTDNWLGMNWCRQEKRLAIFLRDGLACTWCGDGVEDGVRLSLDHIIPASKGGSNHESNVVTACVHCNKGRKALSVAKFATVVAARSRASAATIKRRVRRTAGRPLNVAQAKAMIALRGSCARVLASL